ncbi:MAG: hypothetical protein ABIA21_00395 [Candidatus Aenigmatarchaeota archaeon]
MVQAEIRSDDHRNDRKEAVFMVAEIFDKYYTQMYSQYRQNNQLEHSDSAWKEEKFVLVPHERIMKFTALKTKPMVDRKGGVIGKVRDVLIDAPVINGGIAADFPVVSGVVTDRRIVSWADIASFGDSFVLGKRIFELAHPQIYSNTIFVGRRILDEQLEHENKNIGRVDDVKFAYDAKENKLRVVGICSGVLSRLGMKGFYDTIPWCCVRQIRNEKPTAIVLDLKNRKLLNGLSTHDVQGICRVN